MTEILTRTALTRSSGHYVSSAQESRGAVERGVEKDAYSAVGGLDKQIAQIRDLIEIPLTRPELFRQFGACPVSLRATPA